MLDIDLYNSLELRGRVGLSARALHIGAPVTFDRVGYPHRIYQEAELSCCVDLFGGGYFANLLRAHYCEDLELSADEIDLFRKIGDTVVEMTREKFGRGIRPWVGPLNYIRIFRVIEYLAKLRGRPLTILELGGGSGYLGCVAALTGHRYISMDIAQNMYLWQNRLYTKFFGADFHELAEADISCPLDIDRGAKVVHIPWWHYAAFYKTPPTFTADIVVSERNLGEMTLEGRDFAFAVARDVLAGPKRFTGSRAGDGNIIFTGIGSGHVSDTTEVGRAAAAFGFVPLMDGDLAILTHTDGPAGRSAIGEAYRCAPQKRFQPTEAHPLHAFDWRRDRYMPSGRSDALRTIDHLPLRWSEASTGYEWLRYLDRLNDIPISD